MNKTEKELKILINGPDYHDRTLTLVTEIGAGDYHVGTVLKNGGLSIKDINLALYPLPNNRMYFSYKRNIVNDSRHRKFRSTAKFELLDANKNIVTKFKDQKWYTSCESKREDQLYEKMLDLSAARVKYVRIFIDNYRKSDC